MKGIYSVLLYRIQTDPRKPGKTVNFEKNLGKKYFSPAIQGNSGNLFSRLRLKLTGII